MINIIVGETSQAVSLTFQKVRMLLNISILITYIYVIYKISRKNKVNTSLLFYIRYYGYENIKH